VLGVLGVAALAVVVAAGNVVIHHPPAPVHYVALGDSYSSGTGAGGNSGSCDRSDRAYPALWAQAHRPASFVSVACSGATVASVNDSQLSALSHNTTLVSLTVGGNDVGFSSIMQSCVLRSASKCTNSVNDAERAARNDLAGTLKTLLARISDLAPHAHTIVLGYPHFYDLNHNCVGLAQRARTALDNGIDVLDGVLAAAATEQGAQYLDVRDGFDDHEICDDQRWLHSTELFHLSESYHPTAAGQADGYLPAFTSAA
jgi:lysophospholipase L1-like esterase